MGNLKWMKVEPAALIADTADLSAQEFGAYWRICCRMWANDAVLPNDDRKLARVAGVSLPCWRRTVKPAIWHFFIVGDDLITQKRVRIEWESASRVQATKVINGARGGRAKALKYNAQTIAPATNSPERKPSGRVGEKVADGVALRREEERIPLTEAETQQREQPRTQQSQAPNRLLTALESREGLTAAEKAARARERSSGPTAIRGAPEDSEDER